MPDHVFLSLSKLLGGRRAVTLFPINTTTVLLLTPRFSHRNPVPCMSCRWVSKTYIFLETYSLLINNISHRPLCNSVSEKTWHGCHISLQGCSYPKLDSVNLLQITSFHLYAWLSSQSLNVNSVCWFWRASHSISARWFKCPLWKMLLNPYGPILPSQHCSSYPTVKCCQIRRDVFYCPSSYSNWQHCTVPWFIFNLIYGC